MRCRFATEEADFFGKWTHYPDVDDSLDSVYESEMKKLVDESYDVGLLLRNEE